MLPSLSITLLNTRQIPNPQIGVGHFVGCKMCQIIMKDSAMAAVLSKNDD